MSATTPTTCSEMTPASLALEGVFAPGAFGQVVRGDFDKAFEGKITHTAQMDKSNFCGTGGNTAQTDKSNFNTAQLQRPTEPMAPAALLHLKPTTEIKQ